MRISKLARQTGTTPHAIRFYEREGILPFPDRAANRYREYDEQDIRRLELVLALRRLGVPLREIRSLAGSCFDHRCATSNRQLLDAVDRRSIEVHRQMDELRELAARFAQMKRLLAGDDEQRRSAMIELETEDAAEQAGRTLHADCDCGCAGSGCTCGCECCLSSGTHEQHRQALEVLAQPAEEACGCGCCG